MKRLGVFHIPPPHWMGCPSIAGLPPALNSPVPIYTPWGREAAFNARTPTQLNQKGSSTLLKSTTQNMGCVVYPRSAQTHFNARTPTELNQKGFSTLFKSTTQNIVYVVYPRSTQAHLNTRTRTWLNQKGYTTFARQRDRQV